MKCPSPKPNLVVPWWFFCTGNQMAYAKCTALPTKYNTTHIQTPSCFANFISVEGHTDRGTVTILVCELWVPVTSCSGHNDLNENQTTPFLSGVMCWGHSDLMWLPKEPPLLRNCSTFGLTLVIFHPSGYAQSMTTSTHILHPIPGMHCSPQEGHVLGVYHSCNSQSPSHNCLNLSQQAWPSIILPGSELHHIIKPAVTPGHHSLDTNAQYVMIMYKLTTDQPWWC